MSVWARMVDGLFGTQSSGRKLQQEIDIHRLFLLLATHRQRNPETALHQANAAAQKLSSPEMSTQVQKSLTNQVSADMFHVSLAPSAALPLTVCCGGSGRTDAAGMSPGRPDWKFRETER